MNGVAWDAAYEEAFRRSRLVCACVSVSPLVLGSVLVVVAASGALVPSDDPGVYTFAFGVTALAVAGSIPFVRSLLSRAPAPGSVPYEPGTPASEASALMICDIVSFAIAEIPGVLGFAAGMASGRPLAAVPFLLGSVALYATLWPRRATWETWIAARAMRPSGTLLPGGAQVDAEDPPRAPGTPDAGQGPQAPPEMPPKIDPS